MYTRVLESLRESALAHEMVKKRFLQNDAELIVRTALTLHSFSYNGFDPNFVNYANED